MRHPRFFFGIALGAGSLLFAASAGAATYYVSASGSDSAAGTQAAPWQSLAKVSSTTFAPGDQILFHRGDTFSGTLTPKSSGAAGQPITFGAYGMGAKPVLTGLSALGTWKNVGGNIWEAAVPQGPAALNAVVVAGALRPMGRYPKASAPNGGYLTFESHSGQTSITDSDLAGAPDFTGGEIVLRMVHWLDYRAPITMDAGTTLTFPAFADAAVYPLTDGYGYFIQNHPATLTEDGDWYYKTSTKTIGMYHANGAPAADVATLDNIISFDSKNNLTFTDLAIVGSNAEAIRGNGSSFITVKSCDIRFAGTYAVWLNYTSDVVVQDNLIEHGASDGIDIKSPKHENATITGNTINDTGMVLGLSLSGQTSNQAISVTVKSGATIERNHITDTGYLPIRFDGDDITIKNNVIDGFCSVLDDGGGIYTWNGPKTQFSSRTITGNIVSRGVGAKEGTASGKTQANGIYLDNNANHVTVTDNTVYQMANKGFHTNSPQDVTVKGNTFYDFETGWTVDRWPDDGSSVNGGQDISGLDVEDNIFAAKTVDQTAFEYGDRGLNFPSMSTLEDRVASIGTVTGNYFYTPYPLPFAYYYRPDKNSPFVYPPEQSFEQWKLRSTLEATSTMLPPFPGYTIDSTVGNNLYPDGTFESGIGTIGNFPAGAATLAADTSSKLTGPGSLAITLMPPAKPNDYVLFYHSIGPVASGKKYVLRLSTLGTTDYGLLKATFRKTTTPYNALAPAQYVPFGKTRSDHELIVAPDTTQPDASWEIDILQSSGTVYLDDIEVLEANVTDLDPWSKVRFEVNDTDKDKAVSLAKTYVDARGKAYCGDIALAPYTSLVLFESKVDCVPSMSTGSGGSSAGGSSAGGSNAGGSNAGGSNAGGSSAGGSAGSDDIGADIQMCGCRAAGASDAPLPLALGTGIALAAFSRRCRKSAGRQFARRQKE